ncbi:MAG TPA: cysteine hydrolase [Anaerolineae bacterium]|nr:cysteine hydrolase [Anaerolineae bacterium]
MPGAMPRDDALRHVARRERCAILVIDVQNDFCAVGGAFDREGRSLRDIRAMLPALARFLQSARQAGVPVLYMKHEQSSSRLSPLVRERDRLLFGDGGYPAAGTWGADVCPEVSPAPGEPLLAKTFYSAFSNPDLVRLLAAHKVETLVFAGVLTNVCVETSLRDADTRDYHSVLVSDCTASDVPELYRATLANVEGYFGWVCTSDELLALWNERKGNHDR